MKKLLILINALIVLIHNDVIADTYVTLQNRNIWPTKQSVHVQTNTLGDGSECIVRVACESGPGGWVLTNDQVATIHTAGVYWTPAPMGNGGMYADIHVPDSMDKTILIGCEGPRQNYIGYSISALHCGVTTIEGRYWPKQTAGKNDAKKMFSNWHDYEKLLDVRSTRLRIADKIVLRPGEKTQILTIEELTGTGITVVTNHNIPGLLCTSDRGIRITGKDAKITCTNNNAQQSKGIIQGDLQLDVAVQ